MGITPAGNLLTISQQLGRLIRNQEISIMSTAESLNAIIAKANDIKASSDATAAQVVAALGAVVDEIKRVDATIAELQQQLTGGTVTVEQLAAVSATLDLVKANLGTIADNAAAVKSAADAEDPTPIPPADPA